MRAPRHSTGVVLSHAGRQHSYRVASALQSAGVLDLFFTSSYYKRDLFPDRLARLVPPLDRWLAKRSEPSLDPRRVRRFPWHEIPELAHRFLRGSSGREAELVAMRDMRFDESVSRFLKMLPARAFWGFQGSCYKSLQAAREAGMRSIIELASVPLQVSQRLLDQDGMASKLTNRATSDSSNDYRGRLEQEPAAADICLAASSFTARSLESIGIPSARIQVIPLGVDVRRFAIGKRRQSEQLRLLFVGKLGRHKGLGYLLEAMRRVKSDSVSLSLVGPVVGEDWMFESLDARVEVVGPLGGDDLLRAYADHDVLVFPSLYEGFGLVVLEAMAAGLPVIATANSCAPDVVREGLDGFVIPPFSADAIAERIEWFADNTALIPQMGRNANERAGEFSWGHHARKVGALALAVLDRSP